PVVTETNRDERIRADVNRAQIPRRVVPEERAPQIHFESRLPSDALFELSAALADQVIADVRLAGIGRAFRDLPGAFDALQRDAHLGIARGLGQLFDGVPVPVAAGGTDASVHGDRIALEDRLAQTDALEDLAPVDARDES